MEADLNSDILLFAIPRQSAYADADPSTLQRIWEFQKFKNLDRP